MLGHKSSVEPLIEALKTCGTRSYSRAEFCQGRTKRWAIAWTFTDHPVRDFLPSADVKSTKPITWIIEPKHEYEECLNIVEKLLDDLKVSFRSCTNVFTV